MNDRREENVLLEDLQLMDEKEKSIAVADGTMEKNAKGQDRLKWFWIPKSQIKERENLRSRRVNLLIPEWLAEDRGLI